MVKPLNLFETDLYDYSLPEELIAQNPADPRDSSRLLVLSRQGGGITHSVFSSLGEFLKEGDLLVLNDTRVIPARLFGRKVPGGGRAEILLLKALDSGFSKWEALVRPGRKIPPGTRISLEDGTEVLAGRRLDEGVRVVSFPAGIDVLPLLERIGETPLPPYITRSSAPGSSYQTVFAKNDGSSAAPTASLHFTESLLERLQTERGVRTARLTLHVGLGTFRPVKCADLRAHRIHEEFCALPENTRDIIVKTKAAGGRVIAAGTTSARTLESFAREDGALDWGEKTTGLYIYPGYKFKVIDGLITNFHLPKSSLLMMTAAFAGYGPLMAAYKEAIAMKYRFFSFGDAMFVT
ncbi:MAG: tRNA preQ1(34) S-adenosylmethionine ribosyltransferase-isomerase QueA [Synergistaceae bacterium]|nr:tRNA preQ1(34) S-adenosylmethionine ribosyltransferase-isomerase QueA [Synergistaceae bacterium]